MEIAKTTVRAARSLASRLLDGAGQRLGARLVPMVSPNLDPPFFIVGSGRSGTTLLRRLIVERTRTFIPPETYVLGDVIKTCRRLIGVNWVEYVCYVAGRFEYQSEFKRLGVPTLKPFVENMLAVPVEHQSIAYLVDRLYRFLGEASGVEFSSWGDKTPLNTFYIFEIAMLFPQARFIYTVRDGCDVVSSAKETGLHPDIDIMAQRWVAANGIALNFMSREPDRIHRLSYEDLVSNPDGMMDGVIQFLKLDRLPTPEFERARQMMGDAAELKHLNKSLADVEQSSIGKGRRSMNAQQKQHLGPSMNPMLRRLGYPEL